MATGEGETSRIVAAPSGTSHTPPALALLRTARPKQWVKNLLVFAAPAAAGVLTEPAVAGRTGLAFVAFCLLSSGGYLLNDAHDVEADRAHPIKRARPIARGDLSPAAARAAGLVALLAGLAVSWPARAFWPALAYVGVTASYTLWLKHVAVVDLGMVASGFVIRAIAGGAAADVPVSNWFLMVTTFSALFVVSGRRTDEYEVLQDDARTHRRTLGSYSPAYLRYVRAVSSGVALASYGLWAFERTPTHDFAWSAVSVAPFTLGMLRYAFLVDQGLGGAPEELFLKDRGLQAIFLLWLAAFAAGVYLG